MPLKISTISYFSSNRSEISYGNSKDYYLLVVKNHDINAYLKKSYFWRENRLGRHDGAKGSWASRPDLKVGLMGGSFGLTVTSKAC